MSEQNITKTKKCKICGLEKPFEDFYPTKSGKYGIDSKCKKCDIEENRKFNRSEEGLIFDIYRKQKKQAKELLQYSRDEFYNWLITNQQFLDLHKVWGSSNYDEDLKPACYKIDFDSSYSLENLSLATSKQVKEKYFDDIKKGINQTINSKTSKPVFQYTKDGIFIQRHHSINAAHRYLQELHQTNKKFNIHTCVNGRAKSAYGYKWVEDTTETEKTLYGKKIELKHLNNYLIEDIENILGKEISISTEKEETIKCRIGQGKFRDELINYWGACAVSSFDEIELLMSSHIKPWRDSTNEERLDVYNGLLLTPNLDKAFDKGLITFDIDGNILISKNFKNYNLFGINENMKIEIEEKHKKYLDYHKKNIFK